MAPPQYQSFTTSSSNQEDDDGNGITHTIPVPANAFPGDLMIIAVHHHDAIVLDWPANTVTVSGFTQTSAHVFRVGDRWEDAERRLWVFWKRLTSSDTGNYTVTISGASNGDSTYTPVCIHYKNVKDTGSPFDGTATGSGSGSTLPATSLTTTGPNRVILQIAGNIGGTLTPSSGFTGRKTGAVLNPEIGKITLADRIQTAAGSTGTVRGTASNTSSQYIGVWLAAIASLDKIITLGSSIGTGLSFGTATVLRGAVNLVPPSIAAPAAPTGATVRGRNTVTVGSVTSPAAVPSPAVQVGAVTLGVPSIAAPAAPPAPSVRLRVVAPSVPVTEAVGVPAALAGDLVVPSIGSVEAFGTAELISGGRSLQVASTESAETFGAASVRLSIAPDAVASALAFGAATVSPGAATIEADPAVFASVVPPPWLQTQVLRPDSVPVTEALGAPQVLLRVVVDDGVPNDLFIQSQPELLLGSAVLLPTSVGSRESVPATVQLSLSIDPSARGVRGEIVVAGVRYEALVMARLPQQVGAPTLLVVDAIDWLSIKWSNILNRPQELELTCLLGGLTDPVLQRLRAPAQLATELHVLRDGAVVFAGPLMGGAKRGEQLTLTARGLLAYLRFMVISGEDLWWPNSSDQHLIARGLVDHYQAKRYGNFGIDTSDVLASGVLREGYWKAEELHNVADRFEDLAEGGDDGFDFEIDPATRRLQMWTPKKGVDRSRGDDAVVFDSRNITSDDVQFSVAPGDIASHAIGTGTTSDDNETLYAEAENAELLATFGRAAITESWGRDAPTQATLQRYVNRLLDERDQALWMPGPGVRIDPDSDPSRYDVGDHVWFDGGGRIGVSGKFRVHTRTIEVDDASRETATLEFV